MLHISGGTMLPDCPSPSCPLMVKGTLPLLWSSAETVCQYLFHDCVLAFHGCSLELSHLADWKLPAILKCRRGVSRRS